MEQLHCLIREVYIHRVPPRTTSRAYKAEEWDPQHIWKGRLRVVSVGKECMINLEDAETGALFAQCPYAPDMNAVEAVSDSSRYFVLRVVDKQTGQHAFVGLGFQERTDAFDFNVGLQEFEKTLKYEEETGSQKALEEAHVDYSLKEGQTIRINLAGKTNKQHLAPAPSTPGRASPAIADPWSPSHSFGTAAGKDAFSPLATPVETGADPWGGSAPSPAGAGGSGFADAFGDSFEDAFAKAHPGVESLGTNQTAGTDDPWAIK